MTERTGQRTALAAAEGGGRDYLGDSQAGPSRLWARLYRGSQALTVVAWLMVADIGISIGGLIFDPALVDGNPAWLKPLKFAISTALFLFSMAFVSGRLERFRKVAWVVGGIMAVAFAVEIFLIDMQAARHVTSHFNLSTRFDAEVYQGMGAAVAVVMLGTTAYCGMSLLQRFEDRVLATAIRWGLAASLIGMGTGVMMTLPTPEQKAEMNSRIPERVGSHTVGGVDAGSGASARMPITGWSADHGDLRIAHFLGLHALQAMLLGWVATRQRWSTPRQLCLVRTIGWGAFSLYAVTLWQALRGQPLLRPDGWTWLGWGLWLASTLAGLLPILLAQDRTQRGMEAAQ